MYRQTDCDYEDYVRQLDQLEESLRTTKGEVLVTGDFNSKSSEWGSRRLDHRGEARLHLVVLNKGNTFTFRRGHTGSVVDVTIASERVATKIKGWKVLEDATLSDHQYLEFHIEEVTRRQQDDPAGDQAEIAGCVLQKFDQRWFREALETAKQHCDLQRLAEARDPDELVNYLVSVVVAACDKAMPRRRKPAQTRRSVYWWNPEIADLRRKCMVARPAAQRRRRRDEDGQIIESLQSKFKDARKKLKEAIKSSKRRCWIELCRTIDEDLWGLPYRLVTKKLVGRQPIPGLACPERMREIVNTLFPVQEKRPAAARLDEEPRIEP